MSRRIRQSPDLIDTEETMQTAPVTPARVRLVTRRSRSRVSRYDGARFRNGRKWMDVGNFVPGEIIVAVDPCSGIGLVTATLTLGESLTRIYVYDDEGNSVNDVSLGYDADTLEGALRLGLARVAEWDENGWPEFGKGEG